MPMARGWMSGADQSLMFQTMSASGATVGIDIGTAAFGFSSVASGTYAWTSRLAQQVLQSDFDPHLVRLFDKQGQGWVGQSVVEAGEQLSVSINAQSTVALQASMTSPFDFADFTSAGGAVRVARPVAVAETVGAADDTVAIVRVRQNGENSAVAHLLQGRRSHRHDRRLARRARRAISRRSTAAPTSSRAAARRSTVPAMATSDRPGWPTSMPAT